MLVECRAARAHSRAPYIGGKTTTLVLKAQCYIALKTENVKQPRGYTETHSS